MGGPIVRGKMFFHVNYEGLRQRLDGTQIGLTPSPGFLSQAAAASPALIPVLNAYPSGTAPTSNPGVWQYEAPGRQIDDEDSGMVRLDRYFSDRTTGFVRFNSDEAVERIPTGQLDIRTGPVRAPRRLTTTAGRHAACAFLYAAACRSPGAVRPSSCEDSLRRLKGGV